MARPSWAIATALFAAAAGIGGGAAIYFLGASKPAEPQGLRDVASELDRMLGEKFAATKTRAQTIADFKETPYTLATDPGTVADQNFDDLHFQPHGDETVELGQIKEGKPLVLRRWPKESALAAPLDKVGSSVLMRGAKLQVTSVINVEVPEKREGVETGRVAVSQLVDLAPMRAHLDQIGAARVDLAGQAVLESANHIPDGAQLAVVQLKSEGAADVRVVAAMGQVAGPNLAMAGGAAGGGLLLALVLLIAVKKPEPAPRVTQPGDDLGTASTAFSQALAAPGSTSSGSRQITAAPVGGSLTGSMASQSQSDPGQFGRYTVIRKLGAGGMADVFLARSTGEAGFEKQVALKIMHRALAANPQVVEHFLDEARLASRLTHPNIVQISDLGKTGEDYFIAMEYVDGYDLAYLNAAARQRSAPIPPKIGLTIVRKICDGLQAAHMAMGADGQPLELVHRDVKAENVLISRAGAVKVADFGIAKANQRAVKTQLGMVKGTAAYMPPEQRVGQPVDRTADVYGVGAIAYEVLTGTEINLDLANLAHLGIDGWPHLDAPSKVRPELPVELDAILFKALAYERKDRWQTCAELEEAMEGLAAQKGLQASDKQLAQWVETELGTLEGRA